MHKATSTLCYERMNLSVGFRNFCPEIPAATIWIPIIKSAIAIITPAKAAPNAGDAITANDKMTASRPTAIRKVLDHPECSPDMPSTILAIPLKRRATPIKIIPTKAVATGKASATTANMRTSIPSPTVAKRPLLLLLGRKMPVMIFSNPTNNITTARSTTTEMKV